MRRTSRGPSRNARRFKNTASGGLSGPASAGRPSSSQRRSASAQRAWTGTWRSLSPFPTTVTVRARRSTPLRSRPQSSETRRPAAYKSSKTASSRSVHATERLAWAPLGAWLALFAPSRSCVAFPERARAPPPRPSSSSSIWAADSTAGSRPPGAGDPRRWEGSSERSPRRRHQLKYARSAAALRATLARA